MNNADQEAFPAMTPEAGGYSEGLTKREYFAAKAMQGILAHDGVGTSETYFKRIESIRDTAYLYADAMLKDQS